MWKDGNLVQGRQHCVKSRVQQSVTYRAGACLQCEAKPKIGPTVALLLAICVKDGQIVGIILSSACSLI